MGKRKRERERQERVRLEEERKQTEYLILCHAKKMADEMNLRLIPWLEPGNILWVESIAVTGIAYPAKMPKRENLIRRIGTFLREIGRRISEK